MLSPAGSAFKQVGVASSHNVAELNLEECGMRKDVLHAWVS